MRQIRAANREGYNVVFDNVGSIRRGAETSGDIDILAVGGDAALPGYIELPEPLTGVKAPRIKLPWQAILPLAHVNHVAKLIAEDLNLEVEVRVVARVRGGHAADSSRARMARQK